MFYLLFCCVSFVFFWFTLFCFVLCLFLLPQQKKKAKLVRISNDVPVTWIGSPQEPIGGGKEHKPSQKPLNIFPSDEGFGRHTPRLEMNELSQLVQFIFSQSLAQCV